MKFKNFFIIIIFIFFFTTIGCVSALNETNDYVNYEESIVYSNNRDEEIKYDIVGEINDGGNAELNDIVVDRINDDANNEIGKNVSVETDGEISIDNSGQNQLKNNVYVDSNSLIKGDVKSNSPKGNIKTTITASSVTKFYKDGTLMYAYLKDGSGKPLSGKTINILFGGKTYSKVTNSNGRIAFDVTIGPGTYSVKYSFSQSGYVSSSKTVSITVKAMPTSITANDLTFIYNEGEHYLYAYLKDRNNNPLVDLPMTINFNGKDYTFNTNSNGRIGLKITAGPRVVDTTISFSKGGYVSSSKHVTVTINRIPVTVTVSGVTLDYGGVAYLSATIKDKYGNKLNGKNVEFTFNGVKTTVVSDSNGLAKFRIPNANPGTYSTKVYFYNNPYQIVEKYVSVTIKPIPVSLTVSNLVHNYNDPGYLKVYLKDTKNNVYLKNQPVLFEIDNVVTSTLTDANGCAKLLINNQPGCYDVSISFANNPYSSVSRLVSVEVLSNEPTVNCSGGFYNESFLNLCLNINNNSVVAYSWDNVSWNFSNSSVFFRLGNGIYDLYYKSTGDVYCEHYVVDNHVPLVWSNYDSDIYSTSILVNLSSWDNTDDNPEIFYTLDGSDPYIYGVLYENPLFISSTSSLRFYARDCWGHKSKVVVCNYVYDRVANLNSGKGFSTIQDAIDDADTVDGDYIKVSDGFYLENINVRKSLTIVAEDNVFLSAFDSNRPVISVITGGSGSFIHGFKIVNSTYGVVILSVDNVSIVNNYFCNVFSSIDTDYDNNTLIFNNTIVNDYEIVNMTGILVRNSLNSMIINNYINIEASQISAGIMFISGQASNNVVKGNYINNLCHGNGIGLFIRDCNLSVEDNYVSNFDNGIYVVSYNSVIGSNVFCNNYDGLVLNLSVNNTYKSNNIYDNDRFGVLLMDTTHTRGDSFYLNRICNNVWYDLFSISDDSFVINDNWWGTNNPTVSSKIYNGRGNLVMGSWVVMNIYSSSYNVDENSNLLKARFSLDMTYNNLGKKLSYDGFLPDGLETEFFCLDVKNNDLIRKVSYLKDGVASVYYDLEDLFIDEDTVYVLSYFDKNDKWCFVNKRANISISLLSSALDENTFSKINFNFEIPFSNVTWVTFSWGETGLYTGVINVIVNGVIVESINVTNSVYQECKDDYGVNVFEAMKLYNNFYASTKEGIWVPNAYYLSFASLYNISYTDYNLVHLVFSNRIKSLFNLTDDELEFIENNHTDFVDKIAMIVDYHGDITPDIPFEYNGESMLINHLPSSYAYRISNFYYTNLDSDYEVIGYEGMRSFCVARGVVGDDDLSFYLNQKDLYGPGLMKAAYGTFLTSLLVIYEHDKVAGVAGDAFNVSWSRVSPVCVSLCNDFNCLYITGESDHGMGLEAVGNDSDVWKFHFATSFSFSLVEQLVGNNVWNSTRIGSVTLGLFESYLNNETLELFYSNGYLFLKRENENNTWLFLDTDTGIVRDFFNFHGLLGTMPCYHNNITDNAWAYGCNLLNENSTEFNDLMSVCNGSVYTSFNKGLFGLFSYLFENSEASEFLENLIIGVGSSELVSIGTTIFVVGMMSGQPELIIPGLILIVVGEVGLAYSNGLFDNPNGIDWGFFFLDSGLAIFAPFAGGGLKIGTQSLKVTIERLFLKSGGNIFESLLLKIDYGRVTWSLGKIVYENLYNKPLSMYVEDFLKKDMFYSMAHYVFSESFD